MQKKFATTALLLAFFICFCSGAPAVQAQGKCSLKTMAGSYAMYEKGSSSILDPSQPAEFQPYYVGAVAPFVTISHVTFNDEGIGEGYYWIRFGSINPGFDPLPLQVTITEMNEDCTGKMRYNVSLPGIPSATIEERIIVFDNGRESRTIPTVIENGIADLAWIGESHRISESGSSCGPETAEGTWVTTCNNLIGFTEDLAMADTVVFVTKVSNNGDYTGTLYEKAGALSIESPALGTISVNPDCAVTSTLVLPELFPDATIITKGIYFNEGKENYSIPIGMVSAFCHGKRVGP